MDRSTFLRTVGRNIVLTVSTVISAVWISKGRVSWSKSDHTCIADGICKSCKKISQCKLPSAQSYLNKSGAANTDGFVDV